MTALRRLAARYRLESLAFTAILSAAVFLRFFRLDSYPPGVQHDEVFVSNFAQTILQGQYPIFFELNRGNEPLFMYLVAATFKLFGTTVWALRGTAALAGCAAIGLTYLLVRSLFSSSPVTRGEVRRQDAEAARQGVDLAHQRGEWYLGEAQAIPLLTAAGLAFSFWLLYESRVGLHPISTYLLAVATFYFFWRGWTRGNHWLLLVSGVLAGLSAYTYRSGIFVPVALLVFVVYSFLFHRAAWGENWWLAPLIFIIAALVYAPLGYYIFTHPEGSLARLGDLSGDMNAALAGNPLPLLGNALGVLGMFGIRGDPEWRYNIANRPVFDPLWGMLFYAGLALALWRIKRAPYALAVIWLVVMVLPSVLSPNNPSQHRSVGAIGAAYIFPALALGAIGEWTRARWGSAARWHSVGRVGFIIGVAALVLFAAYEGVRDYFLVWPSNPEVRTIYRADLAEAAHWLDENDSGARVMVSAEFANDLDRGSFNLETTRGRHDAHFFSGADTFVIPDAAGALYVDPSSGAVADDLRKKFLATLGPVYTVPNDLEVFRASAEDFQKWRNDVADKSLAGSADGNLAIRSVSFPDKAEAGSKLRLLMAWQIKTPKVSDADNLTWTIRLVDAKGYVWSEAAGMGYTPSQWMPNDLVVSAFDFGIPVDTPPLALLVSVGLSSKDSEIPLTGEGISSRDGGVTLGSIMVERGPVPSAKPDLPIRYPSKAQFGNAVQLLGSDAVGQVAAGEAWRLVLFWKANATIPADYTIRLQATTQDGDEIAHKDETLLAPDYPTSHWRAGEFIRSVHDLTIPPDAQRGKVVVRVFFLDAKGKPVGRADGVPIAGIEITGRAHEFATPSPAHRLPVRLGDNIDFVGYDIAPTQTRRGEPMTVTLYWHARAAMMQRLTVFVHLLNGEGKVIAQQDSPPLKGEAPTDTWVTGEYLQDAYGLTVPKDEPDNQASIEIGLYDPNTGARLPVFDATGKLLGDRLLIEGIDLFQ